MFVSMITIEWEIKYIKYSPNGLVLYYFHTKLWGCFKKNPRVSQVILIFDVKLVFMMWEFDFKKYDGKSTLKAKGISAKALCSHTELFQRRTRYNGNM